MQILKINILSSNYSEKFDKSTTSGNELISWSYSGDPVPQGRIMCVPLIYIKIEIKHIFHKLKIRVICLQKLIY